MTAKLMPIVNGNALDMKFKSDKANESTRLGKGYTPRESYDDTTPPRDFTNATQRTEYTYGDGDTPIYVRPGALHYKTLPSRGIA